MIKKNDFMNNIENIIIFIILSLILIRLCFYIGKLYGYLMIIIILFFVLPSVYIINRYFINNTDLDYMVYYQQDYDNNEY